jgi:hypothetical protein
MHATCTVAMGTAHRLDSASRGFGDWRVRSGDQLTRCATAAPLRLGWGMSALLAGVIIVGAVCQCVLRFSVSIVRGRTKLHTTHNVPMQTCKLCDAAQVDGGAK